MNLTESNLIALDTKLKQGQRCIRIGNSIIPVGVGGIFAPSSNSSAPAGADVTLGVVDSQGRFQALKFNGTQASNSGSAIQVQNYKTWNSTLPAPSPAPSAGMDFYKCSYVNSNSWGGYKAVQDPVTGIYSFESDSTEGLMYSFVKPQVGKVYIESALVEAKLYVGMVFYAPLSSYTATAETGQTLTYNGTPSFSTVDGIPCATFSGQYINFDASDLPTGNSARTISLWMRATDSGVRMAFSYGNVSGDQNIQIFEVDNICIGSTANDMPTISESAQGSWKHVVLIISGGSATAYVNNVLVSSDTSIQWTTTASDGVIGGRSGGAYTWNGSIAAVRVYDHALSIAEIADLYAEFSPSA